MKEIENRKKVLIDLEGECRKQRQSIKESKLKQRLIKLNNVKSNIEREIYLLEVKNDGFYKKIEEVDREIDEKKKEYNCSKNRIQDVKFNLNKNYLPPMKKTSSFKR